MKKEENKVKLAGASNKCPPSQANLQKFKLAQEGTYQKAFLEVERGKKTSHWMWFIFPQIKGLGNSNLSHYYGLSGLKEAKAYYEDKILGNRLIALCDILIRNNGRNPEKIFGYTDSKKLKSSMTIFYLATKDDHFKEVLDKYFEGNLDSLTIKIIEKLTKNAKEDI